MHPGVQCILSLVSFFFRTHAINYLGGPCDNYMKKPFLKVYAPTVWRDCFCRSRKAFDNDDVTSMCFEAQLFLTVGFNSLMPQLL